MQEDQEILTNKNSWLQIWYFLLILRMLGHYHFLTFSTSHVSPSSSPSWVLAEQAVIVHLRFPRFYVLRVWIIYNVLMGTSSGCKAWTKSCLLAKIKRGAFASSFSWINSNLLVRAFLALIQPPWLYWYRQNRWHIQVHQYW